MWAFYLSNNGPFRCQQYFFNWPSPPTPCPELFLYLLVYLATHLIEIVLRRIDFGRMYAARFAWDLHWIYNKHPTFQGVVISQTFGSSSVCTISVLSKTQSFVDTAHVHGSMDTAHVHGSMDSAHVHGPSHLTDPIIRGHCPCAWSQPSHRPNHSWTLPMSWHYPLNHVHGPSHLTDPIIRGHRPCAWSQPSHRPNHSWTLPMSWHYPLNHVHGSQPSHNWCILENGKQKFGPKCQQWETKRILWFCPCGSGGDNELIMMAIIFGEIMQRTLLAFETGLVMVNPAQHKDNPIISWARVWFM